MKHVQVEMNFISFLEDTPSNYSTVQVLSRLGKSLNLNKYVFVDVNQFKELAESGRNKNWYQVNVESPNLLGFLLNLDMDKIQHAVTNDPNVDLELYWQPNEKMNFRFAKREEVKPISIKTKIMDSLESTGRVRFSFSELARTINRARGREDLGIKLDYYSLALYRDGYLIKPGKEKRHVVNVEYGIWELVK